MNVIIGSGGKKVKSIIEESGVEAIDMQDNGIVSIDWGILFQSNMLLSLVLVMSTLCVCALTG